MKGSFHRVLPAADGDILLPFSTIIFETAAFGLMSGGGLPGSASSRPAVCNGLVVVGQFGLTECVGGIRRG